jgi:hypothetical protein
VSRLGPRVEPPLGVQRDDPKALLHVHHHRSRAPVLRQEADPFHAPLRDPALLPADGVPAVRPHPVPVVVAGDEDRPGARLPDHVHLGVEPPHRLAASRSPGIGDAAGIYVVAQVDHHALTRRLGQIGGERLEHRLAGAVGGAGVAHQKEAGFHELRSDWGDRSGTRWRPAAGRGEDEGWHPRLHCAKTRWWICSRMRDRAVRYRGSSRTGSNSLESNTRRSKPSGDVLKARSSHCTVRGTSPACAK